MITLEGLTVSFGAIRPIDRLSVVLDAPVHGVVGPNGAGKTTLLNAISGFVPSSGRVVADGEEVHAMSAARRSRWGLRRTFQTEQLVDSLSIRDNVRVGADTSVAASGRRQATSRALDFVGLDRVERSPQTLTTLERRLVELARAVVGTPRIVLLDEPASGLSGAETDQLGAIVCAIPDEFDAQVILVEHDIDMIRRSCGRTTVLEFGALLACGPTADVFADAAVVRAWIGELTP